MKNMKQLSDFERYVILEKGTEKPFSGKYNNHKEKGIYICKQCQAPLYYSESKFDAGCGWPAFDDEIAGAIKKQPDADGRRTEIICNHCLAHLGHVFYNEGFTDKNTRHCVNSVSMEFLSKYNDLKIEAGIFASGCFWGTQHFFNRASGVIATEVGYIGGHVKNPTYEDVCTSETGHAEAVRVLFDNEKISFDDLVKLFFETHNFSQKNGQGPDIGEQYRSEIFYSFEEQKKIAEKYISFLKEKKHEVATKITAATAFYKAENYHQNYYNKTGGIPYCHAYKKIF